MKARTALRLAWENPAPVVRPAEAPRAALALMPRPPRPAVPAVPPAVPRRVNLALAIEAQLAGELGLSEPQFLDLFARGELQA